MDEDHQKNLIASDLAKLMNSDLNSKQSYLDKTIPADFPFTILDKGEPYWNEVFDLDSFYYRQTNGVTLIREFDGEYIAVLVEKPSNIHDDNDNDNNNDDRSNPNGGSWEFKLVVQISNLRNGMKLLLKTTVSADDITIDSTAVKMPTDPQYSDPTVYKLDKEGNLQSALREYLKTRGITETTNRILYDYMVWKSQTKRPPKLAMEILHKFIED